MQIHEAGREQTILQDMKAGQKTIEARLAKGKFLNFKPGDLVRLREDVYQDGVIIRSTPDSGLSEITQVKRFDTFREMLEMVGVSSVLPRAKSIDDAIAEIRKFYSPEEEDRYGVLAIYFKMRH